jgi:MFS family permease
MSEVLGRRKLFIGTYILFTIFNGGVIASQNIWTLIILRFLAGTAGSSPLTNAGGTVADVFSAGERGLGMAIFAAAPFAGPAVGPIVSDKHRQILEEELTRSRLEVSLENRVGGDGLPL